MLRSNQSKIKVEESQLSVATRQFIQGRGHKDYVEQLQILANRPNTGTNEFERGIQEGERRVYLDLINSLRG